MGGNVFPGKNKRFTAREYFDILPEIENLMDFIATKFAVIPAYSEKSSFGDMDILFIPNEKFDISKTNEIFSSNGLIKKNGEVTSLIYKEIQIDLIKTNSETFNYSLDYFSWNDLGNLRGKIIHKFGLKHGHNGLWLPVRSKDHTLGNVLLTLDPNLTNKIFDVEAKCEINTLDDIFKIITSSKYFNPAIFAFEEMNAVARVRDKKRSTYNSFLAHIKDTPAPAMHGWHEFFSDKSLYNNFIFHHFPHAKLEVEQLWKKASEIESANEKFNGDIVKTITGLDGVELGIIMKDLKNKLTIDKIIQMDKKDIDDFVLLTFKSRVIGKTPEYSKKY